MPARNRDAAFIHLISDELAQAMEHSRILGLYCALQRFLEVRTIRRESRLISSNTAGHWGHAYLHCALPENRGRQIIDITSDDAHCVSCMQEMGNKSIVGCETNLPIGACLPYYVTCSVAPAPIETFQCTPQFRGPRQHSVSRTRHRTIRLLATHSLHDFLVLQPTRRSIIAFPQYLT